MLSQHESIKQAYESKKKVAWIELKHRYDHLQMINKKAKKSQELIEEFKGLSYFQYITTEDKEFVSLDKKKLH